EKNITENGNEQLTLSPNGLKVKSYNIMKELGLGELPPYNRVRVEFSRTSDIAVPQPTVSNFYSYGTKFDRVGLVLSAPPLLVAFRNVREKKKNDDEEVEF